jgi:aspartyl/glutamyl-tRNA(Asn/Gln) amidotransferase C subunit
MNPEDFEQLLALAHLQLPDSERELILRQINEIINHINRIQSLSLPEEASFFYPNQRSLPLRPDEPSPASFKEIMMLNAPATHGPYIACPPVISAKVAHPTTPVLPPEEDSSPSS